MEIDYRMKMAVTFCNQFKCNTFELNESVVQVQECLYVSLDQ